MISPPPSALRVEYLDGEIFYLDGVRYEHGAIQMHIGGILYTQLAHPDYALLSSNVSIRASQTAIFFPDSDRGTRPTPLSQRAETTCSIPPWW